MKKLKYTIAIILLVGFSSCSDFLDVNDNPNQLIEVPTGDLLLKGTLLANAQIHKGHLLRSSMYYSGQLIGKQLVQQTIYLYNFTPGDSDSNWEHLYNGIMVQNKKIKELSPNNNHLLGIIDINEGLAISTAATIWGDIPYSNAIPDDPGLSSAKPTYDSQVSVYDAALALLDDGISTLTGASTNTATRDQDIVFNGSQAKWIAAAHSIKARIHLLRGNYNAAITEAAQGILSAANDMNYNPIGTVDDNSNIMYNLVNSSRAGDMTGTGAFYRDLIDPDNPNSRNHAKTDETARRRYSFVSGNGSQTNGIDWKTTPQPLINYAENTLIWAESLVRTGDMAGGLAKLNEYRAWLDAGNGFTVLNASDTYNYDAFEMSDFDNGGIENPDGITPVRALLREIIEERYVSGFMTYIPFDDVRRLRKADSDLIVPFPLNTQTATINPQRLLYPRLEIDNNENVPSPLPTIFDPTPINQ